MTQPESLVALEVISGMLILAAGTPVYGCFVEVGVYKGGTAWHLSQLAKGQGRTFFGYDTFTGIPFKDEVDACPVGMFNETSLEQVREDIPYAHFVRGVFPESAVRMPQVGFAHLDCDQYRSIKNSVEYLLPRMIKDGVMWFDDYPHLQGARDAVDELFPADQINIGAGGKAWVRV